MRKFEVDKVYGNDATKFRVVKRTEKFVTVEVIQHFGKYNERVTEVKKLKVNNWEDREVLFTGYHQIEA